MNKPYELSYETLILFWVSLKKSIVEIIEYCRFLKESKLERAKLKARLKNVFSGAPAGGITFIVAILFFFASLFIVPLYILAVKYNQSYLKVFVVSVLLSLVLGVKIYFDIRIWDSKKDNTAKFSIKKDVAIDSLYLWTNVYLVIFGFEGLLRSTNESSKSNLFKKKEVAQIVETALGTSYSMLMIVVVVLIILLIFLHRKKGEFESRKIKSTRTRIKGRYKYTKPRKR